MMSLPVTAWIADAPGPQKSSYDGDTHALAMESPDRMISGEVVPASGGELEQIQFLVGHISVQTTERYLGCTQRIAVNDKTGIEPAS
jgi:hypothetical protein